VRRALLALAVLLLALPALAENPAADPVYWYLEIDNDVVFSTDRWYTSGVRLARLSRDIEWGFSQEVYTPDTRHTVPGTPDRAPSARLMVSVSRHFRGASAYQTVGIAAGVRGPAALGRQVTEAVHRIIPAPEVDWSRQLPNEYDVQVVWARTQRSDAQSPLGDGLKLHFGTVLGNQVLFGHLGAEYRIGTAGSRGLSSPLLRFAPTPPLTDGGAPPAGWSAYAGASVRGVARNQLLTRDYDPTMPDLEAHRAVGRIATGVTYAAKWGSVHFGIAQETREFAGQHASPRFGSLTLHVAF
jgi:lipid A 3-O-deacylase